MCAGVHVALWAMTFTDENIARSFPSSVCERNHNQPEDLIGCREFPNSNQFNERISTRPKRNAWLERKKKIKDFFLKAEETFSRQTKRTESDNRKAWGISKTPNETDAGWVCVYVCGAARLPHFIAPQKAEWMCACVSWRCVDDVDSRWLAGVCVCVLAPSPSEHCFGIIYGILCCMQCACMCVYVCVYYVLFISWLFFCCRNIEEISMSLQSARNINDPKCECFRFGITVGIVVGMILGRFRINTLPLFAFCRRDNGNRFSPLVASETSDFLEKYWKWLIAHSTQFDIMSTTAQLPAFQFSLQLLFIYIAFFFL